MLEAVEVPVEVAELVLSLPAALQPPSRSHSCRFSSLSACVTQCSVDSIDNIVSAMHAARCYCDTHLHSCIQLRHVCCLHSF
jgi:hypothetical protein